MNMTLDEYRCWLVNEILMSSSLEEVKNQVNTAVNHLKQNNVPKTDITWFVGKIINHLGEFSPDDYNMQQWANIYYSRLELQKIMDVSRESKLTH